MSRILIVANFCDGSSLKSRFTYLADLLCRNGHQVDILTSDFNHDTKRLKDPFQNTAMFSVTHIHEPGYPDNISLKRLYSHYIWGRNVGRYVKKSKEKWDIVYCAVPSLTAMRTVGSYAKKHGIKFITDVQDLWPEAFALAVKNKLIRNLAFAPFRQYANIGYSKACKVIGVSDTYTRRGLEPCYESTSGLTVYLGNDGVIFDNARDRYKVHKPEGEIWIAYIGTLGYSYDLKCVIDALASIDHDSITGRPVFIVMGAGPKKAEFEDYAKAKGISAVFTGALKYPEMVGMLCSCDIQVNPIVKNAAQSITNKVGDYALSGLPVINTQENEEYRSLIDKYNCGINCEVGNYRQVADAIIKLIHDPQLRLEMGKNSRRLGIERFDRRHTYKKIMDFIL